MKNLFSAFILLAFFLFTKNDYAVAQNENTPNLVGFGWNAVDDNGSAGPSFRDWMIVPFPATIHGARYLVYGLSLDASLCYSKCKNGIVINGWEISNITNSNNLFFSFDVNLKYDVYRIYNKMFEHDSGVRDKFFTWFDPYILFGYGYAQRSYAHGTKHAPTNNFGAGFNFWIKPYPAFGLNFQGIAKVSMGNGCSNFIHYSAGLIYRFGKPIVTSGTETKKLNMPF
jgi:hypothetical protein